MYLNSTKRMTSRPTCIYR